jgi:Transposase DDE domain
MLSNDKIIGIYCLIDDLLKGINHQEDSRRKVSDSEVITTAIVSCLYFGGHMDNARHMMQMTGMIPEMLDKSRFCRRLHQLESLLCMLFFQIGQHIKDIAGASDYVVDSFPVAVCDNIRIAKCRILKGKQWRGKQCSMRRYFYGVKVQVLTTSSGIPVEFCFVPGSESDVQSLKKLPFTVPPESNIYADSAYTDYSVEDQMKETELVNLMVQRKSNARRKDEPWIRFLKEQMRKGIETTFSMLKGLFLRKIHAVTFKGFLLKIIMFIVAYTFNKLI